MRNITDLIDSIKELVPRISETQLEQLKKAFEDYGVTEMGDIMFLKESEVAPPLKIVEARKLFMEIKRFLEGEIEQNQSEYKSQQTTEQIGKKKKNRKRKKKTNKAQASAPIAKTQVPLKFGVQEEDHAIKENELISGKKLKQNDVTNTVNRSEEQGAEGFSSTQTLAPLKWGIPEHGENLPNSDDAVTEESDLTNTTAVSLVYTASAADNVRSRGTNTDGRHGTIEPTSESENSVVPYEKWDPEKIKFINMSILMFFLTAATYPYFSNALNRVAETDFWGKTKQLLENFFGNNGRCDKDKVIEAYVTGCNVVSMIRKRNVDRSSMQNVVLPLVVDAINNFIDSKK